MAKQLWIFLEWKIIKSLDRVEIFSDEQKNYTATVSTVTVRLLGAYFGCMRSTKCGERRAPARAAR